MTSHAKDAAPRGEKMDFREWQVRYSDQVEEQRNRRVEDREESRRHG